MWIFDEIAFEEKPLGIPYFREEPGSHSYVSLREEPDKIDLLPELIGCAPLRDLLIALNAPTGTARGARRAADRQRTGSTEFGCNCCGSLSSSPSCSSWSSGPILIDGWR